MPDTILQARLRGCAALLLLLLAGAARADCQAVAPTGNGVFTGRSLEVLTLNLAHGRGGALNQLLVGKAQVEANLDALAALLADLAPDVVALQEADAPSRWSGGFDHVAYLSGRAGYPCYVHGHHATATFGTYGTALLTVTPFVRTREHTFAPNPPSNHKGFVKGVLAWNPGSRLAAPVEVTVLSVHLDFLSAKARRSQVDEIATVLEAVRGPLVVLGDFNEEWHAPQSVVRALATRLGLETYAPGATDLATYAGRSRLDWILVGNGLRIASHAVRPETVSDHRAVVASLVLERVP